MITIPSFGDKALDSAFASVFGRPDTDVEDRAHEARARMWTEYLNHSLLLDIPYKKRNGVTVDLAEEVFDAIPGSMTRSLCKAIGQALMKKDKDALYALMKPLKDDAIKQAAEQFAEEQE
jgi:hypothetical protein